MGRILKKKDPSKKKAQRAATAEQQSGLKTSKGGEAAAVKPMSSVRKSTVSEKPKAVTTEPNFLQKSTQFLREVKIELKKVTWPTRKQTMGSTLVVVVLVMIFSLFLGLVDVGLSGLIRVVLP